MVLVIINNEAEAAPARWNRQDDLDATMKTVPLVNWASTLERALHGEAE